MKDVNILCQYTSIKFSIFKWKQFLLLEECTNGWYGLDCKQQCSGHCLDNAVCNHVTGQCDGGCAAGWRAVLCDKGILKFSFLTLL